MNKLIEQLTIEAFFDEATNGSGQKMYTFGEEKMQKFAQLIVQECALTLYKSAVRDKQAGFAHEAKVMELAGHMIKQHFGIKE